MMLASNHLISYLSCHMTGNANENYKVGDLNVEASASVEDEEEDDVDWEEG